MPVFRRCLPGTQKSDRKSHDVHVIVVRYHPCWQCQWLLSERQFCSLLYLSLRVFHDPRFDRRLARGDDAEITGSRYGFLRRHEDTIAAFAGRASPTATANSNQTPSFWPIAAEWEGWRRYLAAVCWFSFLGKRLTRSAFRAAEHRLSFSHGSLLLRVVRWPGIPHFMHDHLSLSFGSRLIHKYVYVVSESLSGSSGSIHSYNSRLLYICECTLTSSMSIVYPYFVTGHRHCLPFELSLL
jgi:hypothetical protein